MKKFLLYDPKLLIYGFLILFFASYGQTFFISLFNNEIRIFYGLSDGEFGLVYAVATLVSSFLLISFAKLIDHLDLRVYSLIITSGFLLACLGMVFLINNILYLFLIIFMLRFFGQGAMDHAGGTTMARYFGNDKGKALSVATLGGMIGVMFLPYFALNFFKDTGLNELWLYATFSIFFFIPFIFLTLSSHKNRHQKFKTELKDNPLNKKLRTRDVLKDKKFYIYLPLSISSSFIGTGLMFHQIFIMDQKGWSLQMLGNSYIFLGFFSIIGLLLGGPLVDKFDTKKTAITTLVPLLLLLIVLIAFEGEFFLIIYMSLYGLTLGIGRPFIGSLWAEIYGVESLGTVKALLHAAAVFASALSPLVFGYLIDWGYGITTIVTISILIIIVSTLLPIYNKLP
ncbi:MFS transporter [Alphaproteobacteria bacterium]|nr:MFS transporter [Alphaproteobacteria bacterium]